MNHSLAPFIQAFLSHYLPTVKGLSINTVAAYRDGIKLLLCYVGDKLPRAVDALLVEDMTEPVILTFLDHLESVRNCTPRTRNARLAAISSLFSYIARKEPTLIAQCQQIRAIPQKRCQHKVVHYLEESQMQAVLNGIDIDSRTGVRDKALLLLLYNTGARVSEIVGLKRDDLELHNLLQVKLTGKGNKERTCPLWPDTADALKVYLQQRNSVAPQTQQLFLNANGAPISRFGIHHMTCRLGAQAQKSSTTEKRLNPHVIRHTAAMHLLRAGNEISMVSFWLGHTHVNTTHIYVEIDMEMKRKMINKAGAPQVSSQKPWQKPDILKWLRELNKRPELCGAS